MIERPPCWRDGQPCPNACAHRHYQQVVHNTTPLHGPWSGWRVAGARLVSPHRDWIHAPALDRLLWREARFR